MFPTPRGTRGFQGWQFACVMIQANPMSLKTLTVLVCALVLGLAGCTSSPQEKEAKYLKKGQALMEQKDYPRAVLEFKNAVKEMPKDAEAYYQLSLAYLAMSNPQAAVNQLRKATELNPNHQQAQLKLAGMMLGTRNRDLVQDAEKRLQGVVSGAPDNPEAIDSLAIAEAQLGKPEEATKRLEEALQKFPTHLKSAVALARLKLAARDIEGAETVLKQAAASAPNSADAAVALGQFYLASRKIELAETEFQRALQVDGKHAGALISMGAIYMATNRAAQAEPLYARASALPDKNLRFLHATYLFQQNRKNEALAEFEKLYKADNEDRAARSRLVALYINLNRRSDAEKVLAEALKKNAKDGEALMQRAELYIQQGNGVEAEKDIRQVLRLRNDSGEAHYALARALGVQGLVTEKQELNEAIRLNPALLPARIRLAQLFLLARETKSAFDLMEQTPPQQKNTLGFVVQRNWVLLAQENYKEVRTALDKALQAVKAPDLLLQDALVKMNDKDNAGARASAEQVLKQNPEDIRAARIVADTYLAAKQAPKAVEAIHALVMQKPQSAALQLFYGQLLNGTGDRAGARVAFEAAKAAAPKAKMIDVTLAQMDLAENQTDAARRRLEGVLAADKNNAEAEFMLAALDDRAGNRAGAVARYRRIVETDGNNALALNNLAYLLAQENPDEALKYAQQAAEKAPNNAAIQDTLGWCYYRKGIYRTAVGYLKTAVEKEPTPRRQFHLGMGYMKSGEQGLGQELIRKALQQDASLSKTEQGW